MPSFEGPLAPFLKGFHYGSSFIYCFEAFIVYLCRDSHLAFDYGYLVFVLLILRDSYRKFGTIGGLCLSAPTISLIQLISQDFQLSYIFGLFLFVRLASSHLKTWILCDGPPDTESGILNFHLWCLLCYVGTSVLLFALPYIPAMLRFAFGSCLKTTLMLIKISPIVLVLALPLYFLDAQRRQLWLARARHTIFYYTVDIPAQALVRACGIISSQFFGDPSGHWWHRPWLYFDGPDAYEYTPLESPTSQIRLLTLFRRCPFGEICGRLDVVPLELSPAYDSISYCWGSEVLDHGIFIGDSYLSVTKNAYEVLHARSSYFRERVLWIDAICINQRSNPEKNIQVLLMGKIYSQSTRTIVWLGFKQSAMFVPDILVELNLFQLFGLDELHLYNRYGSGQRSLQFSALVELLQHPWFLRVWVIQEVAMSSTIHVIYGGQYIKWEMLISALEAFRTPQMMAILSGFESPFIRRRVPDGLHRLALMNRLRNQVGSNETIRLGELLGSTIDCLAGNARDKVFAIQGMVNPTLPAEMKVDYKSTAAQVYLQTAHHLLPDDYLLWVLPFAGVGQTREIKVADLPSWVPDWSCPPPAAILTDLPLFGPSVPESRRSYRTSGSFTQPNTLQSSGSTLCLRGIRVQVLSPERICKHELSSVMKGPVNIIDLARESQDLLRESWRMAQQFTNGRYGNDVGLADAYWRTLIGDLTFDGRRPAPAYWGEYYEVVKRASELDFDPDNLPTLSEEDSFKGMEFSSLSSGRRNFRKFCITDGGYMGWVPRLSKPDDIVVVIFGAQVPFILRPVTEDCRIKVDVPNYELVGECYMHGMMSGQMMERIRGAEDFLLV